MSLFHSQNRMLDGRQRGRFYLYEEGKDVYGDDPRRRAKELWVESTTALEMSIGIVPYVLGVFFAFNERPLLQLFAPGFKDVSGNWTQGPVYQSFIYDGRIVPNVGTFRCPDTFSILAKEEEYRRKTRNLEHYLVEAPRMHPDIVKFSF